MHGQDHIEFRFGPAWDGFQFVFDVDALLAFIESAQDAMGQLEDPQAVEAV